MVEPIVISNSAGDSFSVRFRDCPICNVDDVSLVGYRGGTFHRYRLGIESRIVRCRNCGLIYPNPFPYPLNSKHLYGDPEKYFMGTPSTQLSALTRNTPGERLEGSFFGHYNLPATRWCLFSLSLTPKAS